MSETPECSGMLPSEMSSESPPYQLNGQKNGQQCCGSMKPHKHGSHVYMTLAPLDRMGKCIDLRLALLQKQNVSAKIRNTLVLIFIPPGELMCKKGKINACQMTAKQTQSKKADMEHQGLNSVGASLN